MPAFLSKVENGKTNFVLRFDPRLSARLLQFMTYVCLNPR